MSSDERKKFIEKLIWVCFLCIFIGCIGLVLVNYDSIGAFFKKAISLTYPFVIGLIIAYLLAPVTNKIIIKLSNTKKGKNKSFHRLNMEAVAITQTVFILALLAFVTTLAISIVNSGLNILDSLPRAMENTRLAIDTHIENNEVLKGILGESCEEMFNNISLFISNIFNENFNAITEKAALAVKDVFGYIIDILLALIISVFALAGRDKFAYQAERMLRAITSDKLYKIIIDEVHVINYKFSGFFTGKIIDSTIVGIVSLVILLIMRMPYAVLISAIIFVTNIVPIIGPIIGAVPSAIIIFSVSPIKSLYFIIFIIILQQIDGHILGPKCIGNATNLTTFWVLFALLFFGGLWGLFGMIIGVPLFAVIYDLIGKMTNYLLERKEASKKINKP